MGDCSTVWNSMHEKYNDTLVALSDNTAFPSELSLQSYTHSPRSIGVPEWVQECNPIPIQSHRSQWNLLRRRHTED